MLAKNSVGEIGGNSVVIINWSSLPPCIEEKRRVEQVVHYTTNAMTIKIDPDMALSKASRSS